MDAITPKRRSRWKKPPLLDDEGKPREPAITGNDKDILALLMPGYGRRPWGYPILRTTRISALLQRDHTTVLERLDLLASKPNNYLYLPRQGKSNFRQLIYALDKRGAEYLGEKTPKLSHFFEHQLMECDIAASFELATKEHSHVKIFSWPIVMSSDDFPSRTRGLASPTSMPAAGNQVMRADWSPFVVKVEGDAKPYTFMPGFEADTGSEVLDTGNPERSSIRKKFLDYLYIIENKVYRTHFGARTFFVPFVTTNEERMHSMMELLESIIVANKLPKEYARHFGFKWIPPYEDKPLPPTGHMLIEPWQRVFHDPRQFVE